VSSPSVSSSNHYSWTAWQWRWMRYVRWKRRQISDSTAETACCENPRYWRL